MKKFLAVLTFLLVPTVSFGAMTCVQTAFFPLQLYTPAIQVQKYILHLTCTCDTTPGTATATLGTEIMRNLSGKYGYTITTDPGSTAPTDASDLAISDSRGLALLTATVNGLNLVDATTTEQEYFEGPNGDSYPLFSAAFPLTITLTNNAVNNSIFNLYIDMTE
jgi:hypothetical protein